MGIVDDDLREDVAGQDIGFGCDQASISCELDLGLAKGSVGEKRNWLGRLHEGAIADDALCR